MESKFEHSQGGGVITPDTSTAPDFHQKMKKKIFGLNIYNKTKSLKSCEKGELKLKR